MFRICFLSGKKSLKTSLVISAVFWGLLAGAHSASAATVDGTACKPDLPLQFLFFAFNPGSLGYGAGAAYVTEAGSLGAHALIACNIPNSDNLGSTIRFRARVNDSSIDHAINCRGVVTDVLGSAGVFTTPWVSTSVSGTGSSTLTMQVAAPSSTQTPFYIYRLECEMPEPQFGVGSFPGLSSISAIILD